LELSWAVLGLSWSPGSAKSVLGPFWVHFWVHFGVHFEDHFGTILGSFFGLLFGAILGPFWCPFWSAFWGQIGLKGKQDEPKSAIKSFKEQTSCIFKNLKKPSVFVGF
jgi:hypothetical protein